MSDNKSSYLEIAGKNKDFSEKMDKKLSVYDRAHGSLYLFVGGQNLSL